VDALDITVLSKEHHDCFVDIVELEILFMSYYAHRLWLEKFGVKRKMNNSVNNKLFFLRTGRDSDYSIPRAKHLDMACGTSLFSGSTYIDVQTFVSVS
jgi:hypothetical protein